VRRMNVNGFLVIVRDLAINQLNRFVGFAEVVIATFVEVAIIIGCENPSSISPNFRI
jgi:hypothetical protein